jgi:hypothetical protein
MQQGDRRSTLWTPILHTTPESLFQEKITMRTPFKASTRLAAPLILATASLSLFALHCSSDDGTQPTLGSGGTGAPTGGMAGTTAQQAGSTSGGMTTGGVTTAGTASGGTATAGTTTGGTLTAGGSGGSGGAAGGSGGAAGGSGGAAGGSGGGGGASGVTFAQVKELLSKSCAGMKCHDAASMQMDWTTADGLYMRLTTAIPADIPLCKGKVPIVPSQPDQSLLVQAVKGLKPMCDKSAGGTEALAKMPDDCPQNNRPCLTDMQIKLITDWISAGAPM